MREKKISLRAQLGYDTIWLVRNPVAGPPRRRRRWERSLGRIQKDLSAQDLKSEVKDTSDRGDGAKLVEEAAQNGVGLVIFVGGDGFVNEGLLPSLALGENAPELAAVPGGTENIFADAIGASSRPRKAIKQIVHGERRKVDVGIVQNEDKQYAFIANAGLGIDAEATRVVDASGKRRKSRITFLRAGLKARKEYRPPPIKIVAHDEQGHMIGSRDATSPRIVLFNNMGNYGGVVRLTDSFPYDKQIEMAMLVAQERELLKIFGAILPHALLRRVIHFLGNVPYLEHMRGTSYTVESNRPVPFHVDGEYKGELMPGATITTEQVIFRIPQKGKSKK